MSDFVPFRGRARFRTRLMDRPELVESAEPEAAPEVAAPASEVPQVEAPDAESMPQSPEDLQALVAEAQAEARVEAEAALANIRAEVEAEREALRCLMDGVDRARHTWAREARTQLGEVLLVGVRQIVSESASLQSEALKQRIAEVGERLIGEQKVLLRVPEADTEAARGFLGERDGWKIIGDDSLVSGGCIAETDGGQVDATMGAAFAGLSGSVKEWIDGAEEGEE